MIKNRRSPLVYYPKTVNELLQLYKSMPDSLLFAGGTEILYGRREKYPVLPNNIILLSRIEELAAIKRSEGYLEIGACAKLNKILGIGEHVLKPALYQAIKSIATCEVRNLATLGGNICSSYRKKTLFPLLTLLDTRLELRKHGGSRWINLKKYMIESEGLQPGEVLTRIRIPFNNFNNQAFVITGDLKSDYHNAMTFAFIASVQKEVLSDIRFSIGFSNNSIFRVRDFEDALSGRKLPIFGLTEDPVYNRLTTALKSNDIEISPFRRQQIEGMFLSFLHQLNDTL
ncbi:MAG: FAD binding domain-containing protein [Spirochaetales bacterium]|nr:FAD binding domain-containing protein [Spirochaetales bacterium]